MSPVDDLVACDRFGRLSARACRRRQLERRVVEDAKGKMRAGPFVYEHCAVGGCVTGDAVAADLRALKVPTSVCDACGRAYIGPEATGPCPSCSPGKVLPETKRTEVSTRLWSGEVPDVPIGGPPASATPPRKPITFGPPPAARAPAPTPQVVVEEEEQPARDISPTPSPSEPSRAGPGSPAAAAAPAQQGGTPSTPASPADLEAALRALGFKRADVVLVAPLAKGSTLEERTKDALRLLRGGTPLPDPPAAPAPRAVVGIVGGHQGLTGGTDASAARLAAPRQTAAHTAVMTEATCRCGCGRSLRKNNTSGWSGYCNPARYAAGERPPRPSQAKETTMPPKLCSKCRKTLRSDNSTGCCGDRRACEARVAAAKRTTAPSSPAPAKVTKLPPAPPRRPVAGDDLDEIPFDDLIQRRDALDAAIDRRVAVVEEELAALKAAQAKARARVEAAG
jgi:hypothetical protein